MFEDAKRVATLKKQDITIKRIVEAIWRRMCAVPHVIAFYWPFGFFGRNRRKIKAYRDKYAGKRCFVVANGPSLKNTDMSLLKNEYTFGLNRIYMMKEQNGFEPTFLVCIDKRSQTLQFHEDLDKQTMPCFFNFTLRKYFSKKKNQHFLMGKFAATFQTDATKLLGNGKTVTYAAIQLAFYMGFSEVYLIGKDHSYKADAKVGEAIKATGEEENHFMKGYYKPGMVWDSPDLDSEEFAYHLTADVFKKAGRVIKNATIGGYLDIFERVDYYSLFLDKK